MQDDLYALLPVLSILELVIILLYLGHISGCFFYLMSTPTWQTKGGAVQSPAVSLQLGLADLTDVLHD